MKNKFSISLLLIIFSFISFSIGNSFYKDNDKLSFYCDGDTNTIKTLKCEGYYKKINNKLIFVLSRFENKLNNIKGVNKNIIYKKIKYSIDIEKNKSGLNKNERFVYLLLDKYFSNKIKNYLKKENNNIGIINNNTTFCTAQYDPVCGMEINTNNYKTFSNSCTLSNNKTYSYSYKGECKKQNTINDGSLSVKKVLFSKTPEKDLYMNVVQINDGTKKPIIIVIHGGGWKIGNEDTNLDFAKDLAMKGYFVITPTYRYSTEKQYPAQINDVTDAYNWLFKNKNNYNIDIDNIGVFGASAGAYLSMMLGFNNNLNIKAVVSQMGPTDFESLEVDGKKVGWTDLHIKTRTTLTNLLLGCDILIPSSCSNIKEVSPISNYDKKDPPLLLLHGLSDDTVPYEQSVRLFEYGKSIGQNIQLFLEKGLGHEAKVRVNNLDNIYSFYDKYLKKK